MPAIIDGLLWRSLAALATRSYGRSTLTPVIPDVSRLTHEWPEVAYRCRSRESDQDGSFAFRDLDSVIPYSRDSDNIEREIETIERELSGCRGRDDEFTNVIVYAPLVAAVMIVLVCFSRIYLRAHYVSDTVAGLCEAIAWLAVCNIVARAAAMRSAARGLDVLD